MTRGRRTSGSPSVDGFDRTYARLEIGRYELASEGSSPTFLIIGVMDACLYGLGKRPVASDRRGSSRRRRRGRMGRGALLSSRLGGLRERRNS